MAALSYYPYKPLPPLCIRVLSLHPGQAGEPFVCDVIIQLIDSEPYEALSYVWGDPTPAIFVKCLDESDEGVLGIGASLATALNAFWYTDRARCIWVDALCINQQDMAERQSQVRLMGTIYGTAKHVLCWLGTFNGPGGESRARLTIKFLREFNDKPDEHLEAAQRYFHFGDDRVSADRAMLDVWLATKEFFNIEYFHRTWIIQEVGLARHARLHWGMQEVWIDWTEVAAFCSFMDSNGASVINHLDLESWVAKHINLVWSVDSSGEFKFSFVGVLHWARVHRATDPRDYIYCLLSHPTATVNGSLLVQPDYTITTSQAYTRLA
jgi:hypothetical protein